MGYCLLKVLGSEFDLGLFPPPDLGHLCINNELSQVWDPFLNKKSIYFHIGIYKHSLKVISYFNNFCVGNKFMV